MEIRLLYKDFRKNKDFLEGKIIEKEEYLSEKYPEIKDDESKFKNVSFLF